MPTNSSLHPTSDLHSGASASGDSSGRPRVTKAIYLKTHSFYGLFSQSELEIDDEVVRTLIAKRFESLRITLSENSVRTVNGSYLGKDASSNGFAIPLMPQKRVEVQRRHRPTGPTRGWSYPTLVLRRQEGAEGLLLSGICKDKEFEKSHPCIGSVILDLQDKTFYLTDQLEFGSTAYDSEVDPCIPAKIEEIKALSLRSFRYGGVKPQTEGTIMSNDELDAALEDTASAWTIPDMSEAQMDDELDRLLSDEAQAQHPGESVGM